MASKAKDKATSSASGSHFLEAVSLLGYGVLGTQVGSEGVKKVDEPPDANTAFVDPAGLAYIQERGPFYAGGASGAIYSHIGIDQQESFPSDVVAAITQEGLAKYHKYEYGGQPHHVIHVVGPQLYDVTREEALETLALAYKNVLQEFAAASSPELAAIRLLPISGGIFAGDFVDEMPQLTMEALTAGFSALSPAEQERLCGETAVARVGLCIFTEDDLPAFQDAKAAFLRQLASG